MKIVSLEVENVMKLKVVKITPDGSSIVIGGKNAQGKSSVLNCIMSALGGTAFCPKKAVREGEKKGFIELDLGKYKVKRTFTKEGGGTVIVETPEGARFNSPQQMLNGLLNTISFDPLSFAKMGEQGSSGVAKQLDILKMVSGVDTGKLDLEYSQKYDDRADENREVKRLDGILSGMSVHKDVPDEPVSVTALAKELEDTNAENREVTKKKDDVLNRVKCRDGLQGEIDELEQDLESKRENLSELKKWLADNQDTIESMETVDPAPIREKMETAEETNRKVLENASHGQTKKELESTEKRAEKLSDRLDDIKDEKRKLIESSALPVKDLIFDDSGITFQGIPFEQASDAEKLSVSVALGLAMNPELKVLLIREGSSLDEDNLAMVSKMAEDAGGQLWIERVGTGEEMTIIMEDGSVKE